MAALTSDSPQVGSCNMLDSAETRELKLNIDNVSFICDNEYEGRQAKGYTLPGIWIQPTVSYQPLRNVKVEAGVYMLRYWGANKYPNVNYSDIAEWKGDQTQDAFHYLPVMRVQIAPTDNFNIVLGTLHGKNSHRLAEPLYNKEMGLTADPEAGVQLLWNTKPLELDAWVNWDSFIFRNDTHQESFTFGTSIRLKANRPESPFHVYFPLQMLFQHRGGEINYMATQRTVQTWLNAAAGIGADIKTGNPLLTRLGIEALAAGFNTRQGALLPFDSGYGIYAKATADLWRFRISAGYWECKDFVTILGNPLFGAMSTSPDELTYDHPRTILANIRYAQTFGNLCSWGVYVDLFNQLPTDAWSPEPGNFRDTNSMNITAGLYIRINTSVLLKRF